jgi:aryl-alcohol dehydrogenase-like predicted oxidoreductase
MNYRQFKEASVAEIGLGTWQLGSTDWSNIDEKAAFAILNAYVEEGGNFIDTADVYGMGNSERAIGAFLKICKREIFVATKLGRRQDEGKWLNNFSYDAMKRHIETSLENLGLRQLFLEQLHCIPTETMREGKFFDNMRKLQQDGLIRYWGASVETEEEALMCLDQDGIASLQIIFNLLRQHIADKVFTKAREKNVAIIVRVPLASGLLTGKFTEETAFAASDHRNYNANGEFFNVGETFSGIEFHQGVKLSREIGAVLPDENLAQSALRWILDHEEVTTVIPGASKPEHVKSNVQASLLPRLSSQVHGKLRELYDEKIRQAIRGGY